MKEREYNVYYRERGNKEEQEFNCTITCSNKKEARENFENWDNQNNQPRTDRRSAYGICHQQDRQAGSAA